MSVKKNFYLTILSLTISLFIFEAVSGFYLYFSALQTVPIQFTRLGHIFLGLLFVLFFIIYQTVHIVWLYQGQWARVMGLISLTAIVVSSSTGTIWTLVGIREDSKWLYDTHLISSIIAVLVIILHVVPALFRGIKKKAIAEVAVVGGSTVGAIVLLVVIYVTASGYISAVAVESGEAIEPSDEVIKSYEYKYGSNPFYPSETMTSTGGFIDAGIMAGSRSCGRAGCHEEIYDQWYSSAHRWSSSDIFYKRTVEEMARVEGIAATRYCGGCHDPIALLSGRMTPGGSLYSEHSGEGVSCVICHTITDIRHLRGSGSYTFSPPAKYLFEGKEGFANEQLSAMLIRVDPTLHSETYSKDFYSKPEYCAVCHKQFIGKDTNHWGWIKLQDQYGGWDEAGDIKSAAISSLSMIGDNRALIHLMGIARNKRDDVRLDAIKALSKFNNERARELLLDLVKDKIEALDVRSTALSMLCNMAQDKVVEMLTWQL